MYLSSSRRLPDVYAFAQPGQPCTTGESSEMFENRLSKPAALHLLLTSSASWMNDMPVAPAGAQAIAVAKVVLPGTR
jgi:hypothetical protein